MAMGQVAMFNIDLAMIEGDGEFPCPSCRTPISPDDESETTYEIIDLENGNDGNLRSLTIHCKRCGSTILVEGFEALNELNE